MGRKIRYDEAAEKLGVGKATLYSMVCKKRVPHIRMSGRLVLFDEEELDAFIDSHRVPVGNSNIKAAPCTMDGAKR